MSCILVSAIEENSPPWKSIVGAVPFNITVAKLCWLEKVPVSLLGSNASGKKNLPPSKLSSVVGSCDSSVLYVFSFPSPYHQKTSLKTCANLSPYWLVLPAVSKISGYLSWILNIWKALFMCFPLHHLFH
jgi:hypothetical protein